MCWKYCKKRGILCRFIVNDMANFFFWLLPKPYMDVFKRAKVKFYVVNYRVKDDCHKPRIARYKMHVEDLILIWCIRT